jgi:amidase
MTAKENWSAGEKCGPMLSAMDLASAVRAGDLDPVAAVAEALARIAAGDRTVGAFRRARHTEAIAEAHALNKRGDLVRLPLAGVPVAVKDVTAVAGELPCGPEREAPQGPYQADSDIVGRLRAAGAVIVGLTRTPELCLWPMTDTSEAVVRNPLAPAYNAGGSSGGSAAAVAAGFVPLGHGTDAFGSVRSPAAICGLVGISPGTGTVRASDSVNWSGLYTHGPLARTVSDAALMLSVLAERPNLARISSPAPLRIATSVRLPTIGRRIPQEYAAAVTRTAQLLGSANHRVAEATPSYGNLAPALLSRWLCGPGAPAEGLNWPQLERRTRTHLRLGQMVRRAGLVNDQARRTWIARAEDFFTEYDLLITPMLATRPPKALRWRDKGWPANAATATALTAFLGPWDLARFPSMSVPMGHHSAEPPIGVQLVAGPGNESQMLAVAAQLEVLSPH